jgi:hypothetical protein
MNEEIVATIVIGCLPHSGEGNFSQDLPVTVESVGIGSKEAGSLWLVFNRGPVDVEIAELESGNTVTLIPSLTGHLIQPTDHNVALCARAE